MITAERIRTLLEEALPDCAAVVVDQGGAHEHYAAEVVSSAFEGRSRVQQHRMVYAALGGRVGADIHALALRTFTPTTWPHSA